MEYQRLGPEDWVEEWDGEGQHWAFDTLDEAQDFIARIRDQTEQIMPSLTELIEKRRVLNEEREKRRKEAAKKIEPVIKLWIEPFAGGTLANVFAVDDEGRRWGEYTQRVMSGACDWCGEKLYHTWREQDGDLVIGNQHVEVPGYVNENGERVLTAR